MAKKQKLKTHKATAKRVKVTKGGKLMRLKTGGRHLLSKKRPKRKRLAGVPVEISKVDKPRVIKLIGGAK